jgi:hypothetical protein
MESKKAAEVANNEGKKDNSIREFVDNILASGAVLFHDQYHDTYIAYDGNGSNVSKIQSKSSKLWLADYSYSKRKTVVNTDTANRVLQTLAAQALFNGEQYSLSVRSVYNKEGLWYDLGSSAIHIQKNHWEITDQPPIVFKRFAHQKEQVLPQRGGDLRLLLKYINIHDEQEKLLFLVYVVTTFIPDYPHPLLILYGAQGAGKTTPMKMMKELIDPSALSGLSTPKNIEVFVQTASHHSFLFYDNLSKMPEWFSDALARVATGDSFSKRELYTDDDDVIYRLQNSIALNGINQVVYKSDLLDRSILVHLDRISPDQRKEYQVLWAEFEHDRPAILGAIFDALASALALYPDVKLARLPRMADFTRWGYAIAEAVGFSGESFVKAYNGNISVQHDEAIEANPVAKAILAFMQERTYWQGTAADLYIELNKLAWDLQISQSKGWPKDAPRLGRALAIIEPNLLAKGIDVEHSRATERLITICKLTVDADVTDNLDSDSDKNDRQYDGNDSKNLKANDEL